MRSEYDDVIRAWLDGAEVEQMHPIVTQGDWECFDGMWMTMWNSGWQYRIAKPAKEPKYLWAYHDVKTLGCRLSTCDLSHDPRRFTYLGKIRLEE